MDGGTGVDGGRLNDAPGSVDSGTGLDAPSASDADPTGDGAVGVDGGSATDAGGPDTGRADARSPGADAALIAPSGCNGVDDDGDTLIDELELFGPSALLPRRSMPAQVLPTLFNGTEVITVYADSTSGSPDLVMQRIATDGTLPAAPSVLFADEWTQSRPSIVWDGSAVAVAWVDDRSGMLEAWMGVFSIDGTAVVSPRRVSPIGTSINPAGLAGQQGAQIAWSGGAYLLAWVVETGPMTARTWTAALASDGSVVRAPAVVADLEGMTSLVGDSTGFLIAAGGWFGGSRVGRFNSVGTYLGYEDSTANYNYINHVFSGSGGMYLIYYERTPGGRFLLQRWSTTVGPLGSAVPMAISSGGNIHIGVGIAPGASHIFFSWGLALTARREADFGYVSGVHPHVDSYPATLVHTDRSVIAISNDVPPGLGVRRLGCF